MLKLQEVMPVLIKRRQVKKRVKTAKMAKILRMVRSPKKRMPRR